MNFSPMKNAIELLKKSSERYAKALCGLACQGFAGPFSEQSLQHLNSDLLKIFSPNS